jgi:hypothetical protein
MPAHRHRLVQRPPQSQTAVDRSGHRDPQRLRSDLACPVRLASHIFVSATGNQVTAATVGKIFGRIWDQAALSRPVAGQQPRPYDLRHPFAYANIHRWMKQGNDVAAMLPCLSLYRGHATFDSTHYTCTPRLTSSTATPKSPGRASRYCPRSDSNETRPENRCAGLLLLRPRLPPRLPAQRPGDPHRRPSRHIGSVWSAT